MLLNAAGVKMSTLDLLDLSLKPADGRYDPTAKATGRAVLRPVGGRRRQPAAAADPQDAPRLSAFETLGADRRRLPKRGHAAPQIAFCGPTRQRGGFFGLATTQIRRTLIDLARHHFGPQGQAAQHETHDDSHPVTHDSPESLESWASFHEAVDRLPDQEQEVFQLVWYGGLPQQEVASLLGISVPTVQRRWYRSRHHLQNALSGDHPSME